MSSEKRFLGDILSSSPTPRQAVDEGYNGWVFGAKEPNERLGNLNIGPGIHLGHQTSPDSDNNHSVRTHQGTLEGLDESWRLRVHRPARALSDCTRTTNLAE